MFAIYNSGNLVQTPNLSNEDYKACRRGEVDLVDITNGTQYSNGDWHRIENIDVGDCVLG